MLLLVSLLASLSAHAGCGFAYENKLADAEAALDVVDGAADPDALLIAVQGATNAVDCLGVPITPAVAGRYHRAMALGSDVHGLLSASDEGLPAVLSLAASFALDPEARHVVKLPPEHAHFSSSAFPERVFEEAPAPVEGSLVFDGSVTLQRPTNTAVFFQRLDAKGKVVSSAYLYPETSLPKYEAREAAVAVAAPEPAPVTPLPTESVTKTSKRPLLRVVGGALGVGALGALGANVALYSSAMNPDTSDAATALSKAGVVNALGASAIVLGVGAGGALGASFVVP